MSKFIAVTSGKGGTGKSTVCAGLGMAFAAQKKRVLMIDMDEGLRCLDLMLGIDSNIVFDFSDILTGRELNDAVYSPKKNDYLNLIPAPANFNTITPQALSELLERLDGSYDIIMLDFPAGIDFTLYSALPQDTQFITVCNPDPVSVRDAAVVCRALPATDEQPLFVINKFVSQMHKRGIYDGIDNIIDETGFRLLGIVPSSDALLLLSVNHRLHRNERAFEALLRISKRLLGERVLLPKFKKI